MRRRFRISLGFAIAGIFVALLFRRVGVGEAAHALTEVGPGVLAVGCGLIVSAYLVRVRRWQLLLRSTGIHATYGGVAPVFFAAFALNNVLPLRAGDVYRWIATAGISGGTLPRAFAAIAVERVLDFTSLAALAGTILIVAPPTDIEYANAMLAFVAIGVVLCLAVLLAAPRAVTHVIARWRPQEPHMPLLRRVLDQVEIVAADVERIVRGRLAWRLIALTLAAWALELSVFVAVARTYDGAAPLLGGLYAGLFGTLATLIPGAPGHVGTFDFFAAQGFGAGGLDAGSAIAAALASHLIIIVPITALGAIRLIIAPRAASDPC